MTDGDQFPFYALELVIPVTRLSTSFVVGAFAPASILLIGRFVLFLCLCVCVGGCGSVCVGVYRVTLPVYFWFDFAAF